MLNKIFNAMEDMGWDLDDFQNVLDYHINSCDNRFEEIVEKESNGENFDEDLKYDMAFIIDFLKCVVELDNKEKGEDIND